MLKCNERKKINPRWFRHRISIKNDVETIDNLGGVSEVEETLANVYADIVPMKQHEKIMYNKLDSQVVYKMIIRYLDVFSDPLTSVKYKIIYDDKIYEIVEAFDLFEDKRFVKIICHQVQS